VCTPAERQRYLGRLSRPLLDRFDLHVELPALLSSEMRAGGHAEPSATIRDRVLAARARQAARFAGAMAKTNADLKGRQLRAMCAIPAEGERLLAAAVERLGLSVRGHDRVLRVARTIADLEGAERLATHHVAEAIQYRGLDRSWRP
jgi:magnesium chelatase family protein